MPQEKMITYKGVKLIKPANISMRMVKKFIQQNGGDYCATVQSIFAFFSKYIKQ